MVPSLPPASLGFISWWRGADTVTYPELSGKSTQVPAFILENELSNGRACRVYCTEVSGPSCPSEYKYWEVHFAERGFADISIM